MFRCWLFDDANFIDLFIFTYNNIMKIYVKCVYLCFIRTRVQNAMIENCIQLDAV